MRIWLSLLTCVVLLAPPAAQCHAAAQGAENRVTGLYFRNAEVSKVLSALARIAHANIVLPEGDNTKITATLNNVTVDEAVRTVAVQAGLAYRRIGNTFVVAKFEDMPRVLAQEGVSEQVEVANADPAAVAKELQSAIPFLTVHTVGRTLSLVGAPEDINQAKKLLQSLDVPPTSSVPTETATVALTNVKATDVQNVLNNSFGKGVAQAVGDTKLVITAPESDLPRIQELVKTLDTGTEASLRYVVYHVKYSSARSLSVSLRTAMQNITVVSGPEQFHIPKTELNLVTGNAINITGTNGSTGGGGLGGSSSGLGGGSSGLGGGLGGTSGGMNTGETGLNDQSGYGGVGGLGGANQQQNGIRSRTLIIGGTDATVQAALQLLDKLDVPTPQVALDVKVVSTNPQTTQNLGIEWANGVNGNPGQLSTQVLEGPNGANPGFPNPVSGSPNPNINGLNLRNVFGFGSLGRLPITFSATLNAFFQRTDVRILAKPTITALDNEEGVIFVGQTNRVRVSAVTPGSNNIVVNTLIEIPIGIILQMTPRVIDDEMIQLRVHPIVSSVSGVVAADGLFNSLVREADTTVRVKSGETIVIGGLLQDEDTKTLDKIPILGDLPLIGQLFRNHSHTHNRQEVLVFVTPHLVKE